MQGEERQEKQHQLVNAFRQADRIIKRVIDKRVSGTGVYRSQHRLLMILGKNPDCSQAELAQRLEVSPAAVAVSLKKLERAGYIIRENSSEDNRMNHVIITPKGQDIIWLSIAYFREMEMEMFQNFSSEELELLQSCLNRMVQNGEAYYQKLIEEEKN